MEGAFCCCRCARLLGAGSLKFAVRLSITADFDGHLSAEGEPEEQASEASLAEALAEASALSEEELMAGVHQQMALLVCAGCRAELLRQLGALGFLRGSDGMVQ